MTGVTLPRPRRSRGILGTVVRRVPGAAVASATVFGLLVVLALGADVIRPLDTRTITLGEALQAPSLAHPGAPIWGTDLLGRDLFALAIHGLRVSFTVSLVAAVCAAVIGGTIGIVAGAFGGRTDAVLMRLVDVFASQNHFLFGVLVVVLMRPVVGPAGAVLLSVGLTHWVSIARIVRGELLSLRERPFVVAAINGGSGRLRLARRHYLPHLLPAASLGFVLLVPHAIFHESAYSFLGLGMPAHQASLGNLLADSQQSLLLGAWWASLLPGLLVFLASLSVGTLGEWWRDRRNPRWRSELQL